jgi:hypothetical protein
MEVINQLRTNGKITEGEFNFMNDQAGRAQDSADAGMEKTAKSTMQKAMEQIEAIKPLLPYRSWISRSASTTSRPCRIWTA